MFNQVGGKKLSKKNSKESVTDKIARYVAEKEELQKQARQMFPEEAAKKCPRGYIKREGYKKESYKSHSKSGKNINVKESWTAPACIKSPLGRSVKGEKLIVLMEKDVLKKYGYDDIVHLTKNERHRALRKAIRANKPLSIYRRIIAISTLNKNTNPKLYKILREDAEWIKTQPEYIAKKASNKSSKKSSKKGSKKSSKKGSKK
jgi:hypothetical protein